MVVPLLSGCSTYDPNEHVGETINLYLGDEIYDFDPAYAYRSSSALELSRLMFVGLFHVDDNGKLKKDLVKEYEIEDDDDQGIYRISMELNETYWSDGAVVSA